MCESPSLIFEENMVIRIICHIWQSPAIIWKLQSSAQYTLKSDIVMCSTIIVKDELYLDLVITLIALICHKETFFYLTFVSENNICSSIEPKIRKNIFYLCVIVYYRLATRQSYTLNSTLVWYERKIYKKVIWWFSFWGSWQIRACPFL